MREMIATGAQFTHTLLLHRLLDDRRLRRRRRRDRSLVAVQSALCVDLNKLLRDLRKCRTSSRFS